MRAIRLFFLFFSFSCVCLAGCKRPVNADDLYETESVELRKFAPDLGVRFTRSVLHSKRDSLQFEFLIKTEFYDPTDPGNTMVEFKEEGSLAGSDQYRHEEVISPDRNWIVLKTGNSEGFVFCKREDTLACVRDNSFPVRFRLEYAPHPPDQPFPWVEFLCWEYPATYVFYPVDRDKGAPPPPEEQYRVDLNTGRIHCPVNASPIFTPRLIVPEHDK